MTDIVPPEVIDLARQIAAEHGLAPALVCAVIEQESAWNPWAVRYEPGFLSRYIAPLYTSGKLSATEAYTRAMSWGLMQVMGQVAREFGFKEASLSELCDPAAGIEFGCRILAARMARVDIHNHLPGGFEDGCRSQSLPIGDIEGAVHLLDATVALHDERWGLIRHAAACSLSL